MLERHAIRYSFLGSYWEEPIWPKYSKDLLHVRDRAPTVKGVGHIGIVCLWCREVLSSTRQVDEEHCGKQRADTKAENPKDQESKLFRLPHLRFVPHISVLRHAEGRGSAIRKLREGCGNRDDQPHTAVHPYEKKVLVVVEAHTIIDPETVVVEAQHADAAVVAVVRPLRACLVAQLAVRDLPRLPLWHRCEDRNAEARTPHKLLPLLRYRPRVC
mmetsp:Transcript_156831/g.380946  ORF Transcript_156831/g.380946 Transcript_156831/m.380946 type:complete len:215 (+) Transcript_156831:251-895(+)